MNSRQATDGVLSPEMAGSVLLQELLKRSCTIRHCLIILKGWSGVAKVSCILHHMGVHCPTDIGLQLGKACYPCSRLG